MDLKACKRVISWIVGECFILYEKGLCEENIVFDFLVWLVLPKVDNCGFL